jgi:hypothetical protein
MIATPELLVSVHNCWILVEKIYVSVMASQAAARKAMLELVNNNLACSKLCICYETCENFTSLLSVVL